MNSRIKFYLFLMVIIGFLAGLYGLTLIVFSCLLATILILFAFFWNKYIFLKFSISGYLNQSRVEYGQKLYYHLEVENKKILPLLWVKLEADISREIEFIDNIVISRSFYRYNRLQDYFSLKWYEWTRRSYQFIPQKRGLYKFGDIKLHYSGVLGLFSNTMKQIQTEELIVYPRIISISPSVIKESQLFGAHKKEGWIYQDRLNKVGVRPYQKVDSFKDINWKSSARHLGLESNIYNPSFDKEVHIFLNGPSSGAWWQGIERNKLELEITCAASFVEYSHKKGYRIGFYSNIPAMKERPGQHEGKGAYTGIKMAKNQQQRTRLLTTMALLQTYSIGSISRIMEEEKHNINNGSSIIVITSELSHELKKVLFYYNQYYQLFLIKVGKKNDKIPGIKQLNIDEEESWDEIKVLEYS